MPKYIKIKLINIVAIPVLLLILSVFYIQYTVINNNKNAIEVTNTAVNYARKQCIDEKIDKSVCDSLMYDNEPAQNIKFQGKKAWIAYIYSKVSNSYSAKVIIQIVDGQKTVINFSKNTSIKCNDHS